MKHPPHYENKHQRPIDTQHDKNIIPHINLAAIPDRSRPEAAPSLGAPIRGMHPPNVFPTGGGTGGPLGGRRRRGRGDRWCPRASARAPELGHAQINTGMQTLTAPPPPAHMWGRGGREMQPGRCSGDVTWTNVRKIRGFPRKWVCWWMIRAWCDGDSMSSSLLIRAIDSIMKNEPDPLFARRIRFREYRIKNIYTV